MTAVHSISCEVLFTELNKQILSHDFRWSLTIFAFVGSRRASLYDSTQLSKRWKMLKAHRLSPVLLSWVFELISSPNATQFNKTVFLSWVALGVVTKFHKDLIVSFEFHVKRVRFLLSWCESYATLGNFFSLFLRVWRNKNVLRRTKL